MVDTSNILKFQKPAPRIAKPAGPASDQDCAAEPVRSEQLEEKLAAHFEQLTKKFEGGDTIGKLGEICAQMEKILELFRRL